ncbi:MAG: aminotransferase class IV [Phycisphaerae bacterium]|nr:aminotransferase class IV [Phycisphaerae bacterium]
MQLAMIEDKVIPYAELEPVYLDRGAFFGDGVYEVIRSYEGRLFALDEHLARFARSLREIAIDGVDIADVRQRIETAFDRASIVNAKVYFHITRGSGDRGHGAPKDMKPRFFLTVMELADNPKNKEDGISVSTFPDWRWKRCDIKSLNLLPNVLAKMDAEKKGCGEAILVNDAGEVTEGSSSAFFIVRAGGREIVTRPLGPDILPSITRAIVERMAGEAGVRMIEAAFRPEDAGRAEEMFLAVTTQDIVPVVRFDGTQVGTGRPGACTKRLIEIFAEYARRRR